MNTDSSVTFQWMLIEQRLFHFITKKKKTWKKVIKNFGLPVAPIYELQWHCIDWQMDKESKNVILMLHLKQLIIFLNLLYLSIF